MGWGKLLGDGDNNFVSLELIIPITEVRAGSDKLRDVFIDLPSFETAYNLATQREFILHGGSRPLD